MKRLRWLFFWAHLVTGLAAGAVILVMCVTGAGLALKPQILKMIDRHVRKVEPGGRTPLPVSQIVAGARAAMPDAPLTSIAIEREPSASVALSAGQKTIYADPYTGSILGEASPGPAAFFRSVENWHRWLALPSENRALGRTFTGASNLAFFGLALSGLYLWWPRAWTAQHARPILAFRRASTGRARDFNWHNVIGFWCLLPIVAMTASGIVMSYPWANTLLYRMTGSEPPAAGAGRQGGPGGGPGGERAGIRPAAPVAAANIDQAWRRARESVPEWRAITLRMPARADAPFAFTITDGASWNPFARSQLSLDAVTGEVRQWQPYAGTSLGQRARGWVRFGHTGELAGLVGQIIAGLGCLGGAFLVWTGTSLAIRRLSAFRRRRSAAGVRIERPNAVAARTMEGH